MNDILDMIDDADLDQVAAGADIFSVGTTGSVGSIDFGVDTQKFLTAAGDLFGILSFGFSFPGGLISRR